MINCLPALSRKPNDYSTLNLEVGVRCRQAVTSLGRSANRKPVPMKSTLACILGVFFVAQLSLADQVPDLATRFAELVALNPKQRTEIQNRKIQEIWRSNKDIRDAYDWHELLKPGDSILLFTGLVAGKKINYLPEKREYVISDSKSVPEGDSFDHFSRAVFLTEDFVVIRKHNLKINSR
jgi:hypothetical protein